METGPADGSCFDPSDPEGGWALARGAVVRALAMCPQAVLPAMLRAVERGEREGQSRAGERQGRRWWWWAVQGR